MGCSKKEVIRSDILPLDTEKIYFLSLVIQTSVTTLKKDKKMFT